MQISNRIILGIGCLIIFCLTMGCVATGTRNAGTTTDIAEDQMLRVGVCANMPPIIFKQDRRIVGLEADLANALAATTGKSLCFVEFKWDELIPALLGKKIDIIMSGMSITKTREIRITFSKPYLTVGQMALVRGEDRGKYGNAYSIQFSDAKVATEKSTTGDFLVQQQFTKADRKPFDSPEKAVQALAKGKVDIFIHDAPVVWWLASEYESSGLVPVPAFLTQEQLGWGIPYEDTELLEAVNNFLALREADGSLKRIMQRWIPYIK